MWSEWRGKKALSSGVERAGGADGLFKKSEYD